MFTSNADYGVTQFEFDDAQDLGEGKVWFCDFAHSNPPIKPLHLLYSWLWPGYRGFQQAYEKLSIPTGKGWDVRCKYGRAYPTIMLTTKEEIPERTAAFEKKIEPFIEDFDTIWDAAKNDLYDTYQELKKKYGVANYTDIKNTSNIELLELFEEYIQVNYKTWEVHMYYFVGLFYLYGLFEKLCIDLTGVKTSDPLYVKVMAGFDSMAFRFNKEIFKLGRLAIELGIDHIITEETGAVLDKIKEAQNGAEWMKAFDNFLAVYGWRPERMNEWSTPTWLEKPELALPLLKLSINGGGTSNIDAFMEKARTEREEAEKELLSKVPVDHMDWFSSLMKVAQKAGYWSEDHTFYCELYSSALGRWITKEIGDRFERAGVLDNCEDIHFLIVGEIVRAIVPMGRFKLQKYAAARKAEWEGYCDTEPEPLRGDPAQMGVFVSTDSVIGVASSFPIVREELKADLYGSASTHGCVEGVARVIMSENELDQLKPGEILVAPVTSALWTPAFELITAIVTNDGGALAHALIVAREYSIPAVCGTQEATAKIKTGDRIRVDADLGVVYIL